MDQLDRLVLEAVDLAPDLGGRHRPDLFLEERHQRRPVLEG